MNFSVFGPYKGVTGYDNLLRAFLKAWYYQSHNITLVEFERWSLTRTTTDMDFILREFEKTQINPEFHLNFSLLDQSQLNLQTTNYIYTMFETDKICPAWVEAAQRLDGVIVPTEFNRKSFVESGIPEDKVLVCPVPLDINHIMKAGTKFNVKDYQGNDLSQYKHRFLNVSEYLTRKNVDKLIEVWSDEVKPEDNACLILKLNSNSGLKLDFFRTKIDNIIKSKKCAPIFVYMDFLDENHMLGLYNFCTHYISTSYGEGWGLSESICGILEKKVVAPASTSFKTYLNESNSYPIMVQAVAATQDGPIDIYYAGSKWFAPVTFGIRKQVRKAINDANAGDRTKEIALSKSLKEMCDSNLVANKLVNLIANHKQGKRTPPSPTKGMDYNYLMICKSIGTKCGIADYTNSLYRSMCSDELKKLYNGNLLIRGDAVDYRTIVDQNNLHVVNLQLEYQFCPPKRLFQFLKYLDNSSIQGTVTLHTVNPQAAEHHKAILDTNAKVIVSSEPMKNLLLDRCGFTMDRVQVIPMGIGKEHVRNPIKRADTSKFRIGFFGFCYFHKGVDKLLQYMRLHGSDKECVILSTRPENDHGYFNKMQELMKTTNLPNVAWVADFLEEKSIVDMLSTCDLIFLPYSEYGGYATSAAIRTCLKAGVPIVGFDTNFFRDVVHDLELIKFIGKNPLDFEEWSQNLNSYIKSYGHNELYKQSFLKNRDSFVEVFNWDQIAKRHLEYFGKLLPCESLSECTVK